MFTRACIWALAAALFGTVVWAEAPADTKAEDAKDDANTEEKTEPKPEPKPEKKSDPFTLSIPLGDEEDAPAITLRFFGQHRTRYELRAPAQYNPGLADQTSVQQFNMRTRLGVDAKFPGNANFLFELQDVRLWGDEPRANANSVNTSGFEGLDVLQAYIYTTNLFDIGIEAHAGRQKFTVGNQRLISTLEWAPQSRAWDGIRIARSFLDKQVTVTGFAMLINDLNRVRDDEWMLGLTARWAPDFLKKSDLELLLLYMNRDDISGNNDGHVTTASLRWNGWHGLNSDDSLAIAYTAEGIAQFGTADTAYWGTPGEDNSNVKAFAAALTLDFIMGFGDHSFTVGAEWDYASGDSDPTDNDFQTFRSPFPFGHKYHGFADQIGWRNLHNFSFRATWTVKNVGFVENLSVHLQAHNFQRENDDDAWYNPGGGSIRAGTPDESDLLGNEIDLVISMKVNRWVAFEAGWAHFFAGRFVKQTATGSGPGSDNEDSDMDFIWAQLTLQF